MNGQHFLLSAQRQGGRPRVHRQFRNGIRQASIPIWSMPLTNHPDPVVREAFREFRWGKTTYSIGDAIEYVNKRRRQINGTSPNSQAVYDGSREDVGPLGPGLANFMRKLRS